LHFFLSPVYSLICRCSEIKQKKAQPQIPEPSGFGICFFVVAGISDKIQRSGRILLLPAGLSCPPSRHPDRIGSTVPPGLQSLLFYGYNENQ